MKLTSKIQIWAGFKSYAKGSGGHESLSVEFILRQGSRYKGWGRGEHDNCLGAGAWACAGVGMKIDQVSLD